MGAATLNPLRAATDAFTFAAATEVIGDTLSQDDCWTLRQTVRVVGDD